MPIFTERSIAVAAAFLLAALPVSAEAGKLSKSGELALLAFETLCLPSFEQPLMFYTLSGNRFESRKLRRNLKKREGLLIMPAWSTQSGDVQLSAPLPQKIRVVQRPAG